MVVQLGDFLFLLFGFSSLCSFSNLSLQMKAKNQLRVTFSFSFFFRTRSHCFTSRDLWIHNSGFVRTVFAAYIIFSSFKNIAEYVNLEMSEKKSAYIRLYCGYCTSRKLAKVQWDLSCCVN